MAKNTSLHEFLECHQAGATWTHTALNGGKYCISEDDLPKFYELYAQAYRRSEQLHLTEKSATIGPLRIDFDFVYPPEITTHQHTKEQVCKFVQVYLDEIKKNLIIPETVEVYIMEKDEPTLDTKKNKRKSGIHIVVPSISTHCSVEQRVRRNLLDKMNDIFPGLPTTDSWDKIYDEGVVKRCVPWTMYGSRKSEIHGKTLPYLVTYIVEYSPSGTRVSRDVVEHPLKVDANLIKTLSLGPIDREMTPMTEEAQKLYEMMNQQTKEVRISGGSSVIPSRGRPISRHTEQASRGSSPTGRVVFQPLSEDRKEYLKAHVMNLNPERSEDYKKWIDVGICLHNIHPDLQDVWLDFSRQCGEKYNEADCLNVWNGIKYRNDGERTQEGTLRYWSREDNLEGYRDIESQNVERLILAACSGTEHDVASLIYSIFRDQYKCCDFGKNVWYRWSGHVWRETDRGVDLQLKLSRFVAGKFFEKMTDIHNEMKSRSLMNCSGEDKKECGTCEHCQLEIQRKGYNTMYTKLKTTKFKDNVMKECRELFFDEEFTKKLDSNKELIAFNNGVLELETFEFREGKPEDYLSFSTGIDYDPEKNYYEYDTWNAVETFIKQVLPDKVVREYFVKHLATNLVGGNTAQKFHILTGSGSNGKSMIMNLTSTALGDYACTVPISLFTQKRKGSGNAAPEVIRLKGRRFVTMQEPDESIALNTGLMKEITSGEKMYARDLFKSGTEFEVQAKFHLACNDKPKINTTDGGTWRRLVVINFLSKFVPVPTAPNEFPMDENIQFLVQKKEWATPFMSYLIHILKEGKGLRKLPPPEKVLEYTSEYRNENDGIARFITEKLIAIKDGEEIQPVDTNTLKRVFKQWKEDNDLRSLSPTDLVKRVENVYGAYMRGGWTKFRIDA